ncbi:MAG: 50S ribosomal protein L28, partial [Cytophagales bacterium]
MAKVCELTGKHVSSGNRVSKAKNRSKRNFSPNLQEKNIWLPELKQKIKMKVSAKAIRTMNKHGNYQAMKKAKNKGTLSPRLTRLVAT